MTPSRFRVQLALFSVIALGLFSGFPAHASAPDSLTLQTPTDVKAWSVYNRSTKRFVVWMTWRDSPDSLATYVSPPDMAAWSVTTPPAQLTQPTIRGFYTGDTDRTILFRATLGGAVGVDSVRVEYSIRREEFLSGSLVLTPSYVAGTFVPVTFRDQRTNQTRDFGLEISFSTGRADLQGNFSLGVEDFEGFHMWRGVQPDGSDLEVVGEVSKEEAFKGRKTGGSLADSVYFYDVVPTLRQSQPWISPFGAIDCLGTRIEIPLESDELFWYDCDARNGFTYYYAITTFDRGYNPGSSTQGLVKVDHCPVAEGIPYPCRDELVELKMEVDPQDVLSNVYTVPNPYRDGSSRLTSENYHNYPDRFIRFVNVPDNCTVKVFTVSGDLVWEASHNAPSGNIEWDVTNRDSQPVASGVYLYRVETPQGDSVYGRIVVIR